jgi:hypothetical protein
VKRSKAVLSLADAISSLVIQLSVSRGLRRPVWCHDRISPRGFKVIFKGHRHTRTPLPSVRRGYTESAARNRLNALSVRWIGQPERGAFVPTPKPFAI